jgi:sulfur carrier protein
VQVTLRNPRRTVVVAGPVRVSALLATLDINRESVLVIRNDTLVPGDAVLADADEIEIRPVISGGSGDSGTGVPGDSGTGVPGDSGTGVPGDMP